MPPHPEYGIEHRQLLHRIDPRAGTVTIDGKAHPLLDTRLPTVDFAATRTRSRRRSGPAWTALAQSFLAQRAALEAR